MRILLAGGTGVLGRATVPRLVAAGHELVAVSRRSEADAALRAAGAEPVRLDIFDGGAATQTAEGADVVINVATHIPPTAAAARPKAWAENHRLRREASRVLAEAAVATGARFIQESFAPTYPDGGADWITEDTPLAPVAQTTSVADAEASADLVTSNGGTGIALRFGLFYGAGSPQTREIVNGARKGLFLLPGPRHHYASMVYVEDAAAAVVAALDLPAGAYNVVEDEPLTRSDHAAVLAQLVGRDRLRLMPAVVGRLPVLRALARSHRATNKRLRESSRWRPTAPSVREGWAMVLAEVDREQR